MPNPTEREVMALTLRTNAELVASVLRGTEGIQDDSVMAAISATRSLALLVEDTLHALVQQARAEGHTWAEIGELLHVTRQAAFARFTGAGAAAEALDYSDMPPLEGAEERARQLLDDFLEGRLEEARATFDEGFRQRASLELLKDHRGRLGRRFGAPLEVGTPKVMVRQGFTVVELPVAFEHGDMRSRTVFDVDGQVRGFGLHAVNEPLP